MKELIYFILENSLPSMDGCEVVQSTDEIGEVFTVTIPSEMRGKIIGKGGRNIKAIRDVVSILARRQQTRIFLKIAD